MPVGNVPLAKGRTHAVPGEGSLNALVMFVGEGPGFEEDKQGRPFVGRSGQFLTEMLTNIDLDRRDVLHYQRSQVSTAQQS